jgi:hypothetical protein
VPPAEVAARVLNDADLAAQVPDEATAAGPLARDVVRECGALAQLGRYFGHKLRGATALAVYANNGAADWLAAARTETATAGDAWRRLADQTAYISPFNERLRMAPLGYDPFHWSKEVPGLEADAIALDAAAALTPAAPLARPLPDPQVWLNTGRAPAPPLTELSVDPADPTAPVWTVRARFGAPIAGAVRVLWKPFDSETDWIAVDADQQADGSFATQIAGGGAGALFAVEVVTARGAWRLPDPTVATPYVPLPP